MNETKQEALEFCKDLALLCEDGVRKATEEMIEQGLYPRERIAKLLTKLIGGYQGDEIYPREIIDYLLEKYKV